METIAKIVLNKNRGWRGLAQIDCLDKDANIVKNMIFSFSQPVWDDMLQGCIVIQDKNYYYVIEFNNTDRLPTGQRSVLLKNFMADIIGVWTYAKVDWTSKALSRGHYDKIAHFIKNRNNHTTSDWNCIGVRVVPMI